MLSCYTAHVLSWGHLSSNVSTPYLVHFHFHFLDDQSLRVGGGSPSMTLSSFTANRMLTLQIFCIAVLRARPDTLAAVNIRHTHCAGKPRHPTLTGSRHVFQPCCWWLRCHTVNFSSCGLCCTSLPKAEYILEFEDRKSSQYICCLKSAVISLFPQTA